MGYPWIPAIPTYGKDKGQSIIPLQLWIEEILHQLVTTGKLLSVKHK
jgi:hypothetical protein